MDFWISFANFFASAIRLTAPIALGTLACTISERAGVINIGIEGSMLFSGFLAAVGSYYTGSPWVGLLCGCAALFCREPVVLRGGDCVAKSYEDFWRDYAMLGGKTEELMES